MIIQPIRTPVPLIVACVASCMVVGAASAGPLQAGVPNPASSGTTSIDQLADCRAEAVDARRLACFDRTVAAVIDARRKKDLVILDRTEVRKAKTSLFGFSLPSIKLFGGGGDDEQLKQLIGVMRNSTMLPGGLIRFELEDVPVGGAVAKAGDNKSVWETLEQVMLPIRRGDTVTIKSGALGSYVATAPGRRSARVRRVR
jgi:hypothetical protein